MDEYRAANLRNWESRVVAHTGPGGYDLDRYVNDPQLLSRVVQRDSSYLGDLTGLDVVHLQCHVGSDTISLARLGARITGVDFSPSALAVARDLAARCCIADATFVESELYAVTEVLGRDFDLVYTGVGALNWLPDIAGWARVVASLLRPGGRLFVRDAHPMLNALHDERDDDALVVAHSYFEDTPMRFEAELSYAGDTPLTETVMYEWNHGLGEIVQSVLDAGLTVTALREHRLLEWKQLPRMVEADGGWVLPEAPERVPMMFTPGDVR